MLMDGKFEYGVPYVTYQMVQPDKEFWEVMTPKSPYPLKLHHWKVLPEVRFGWHNYIEVKVHEIDEDYDYWIRVELIAMGHILKAHYFGTKEEAIEYMELYLKNRNLQDKSKVLRGDSSGALCRGWYSLEM